MNTCAALQTALIVVVGTVFAIPAAPQSLVTFSQTAILNDELAVAFEVADFNRDGNKDFLEFTFSSQIFIYLGNGDGSFQSAYQLTGLGSFVRPVVADVNGDSIPDVVGVGSQGVGAWIGKGNGTFQNVIITPAVTTTFPSVTVADINLDGKPDAILGGNGSSSPVSVMLGNGDGTFGSGKLANINTSAPALVADFNQDGIPDLACVGYVGSQDIFILLGKGDGSFQIPMIFPLSGNGTSLQSGDMNGDGIPDLTTVLGSDLVLLICNGDGTFHQGVSVPDPFESSVVLADIDQDGKLDAVLLSQADPVVTVLFGKGDGTFAKQIYYQASTDIAPLSGVAAGDFRHSGQLDILSAGGESPAHYLRNKGNRSFAAAAAYLSPEGSKVFDVEVALTADLNGDGAPDLAWFGTGLEVQLGAGNGRLGKAKAIGPSFPQPYRGTAITSGDFNGDGKQDVVVGYGVGSKPFVLATYLGNGDGTFHSPVFSSVSTPIEVSDAGISAGDFDGDGKLDLAFSYYGNGGGGIDILRGNGTGSFHLASSPSSGGSSTVTVVDLNRDGKPDLVTTSQVLLNNGDGTFRAGLTLSARAVVVDDFNGDRILDIAAIPTDEPFVQILFGKGDGTFPSEEDITVSTDLLLPPLFAGDFNGDGFIDLLLGRFSVLLNQGNGSFEAQPNILDFGVLNPEFYSVGDFNRDGRPDVAVITSDTSLLFLNTTNAQR